MSLFQPPGPAGQRGPRGLGPVPNATGHTLGILVLIAIPRKGKESCEKGESAELRMFLWWAPWTPGLEHHLLKPQKMVSTFLFSLNSLVCQTQTGNSLDIEV